MTALRLGVTLPQFGAAADAAGVASFARRAEDAGAASLWVGDRLLAAREPSVGYAGGPGIPAVFRRALDPFTVLAAAAVSTTTPRLGASVLVAPFYPPAVLARSLTTLQALSGGRVLAGLGIGWSPEEYAAAGVGFDHRGARLEDALDALAVLFAGGADGHAGRFTTVPPAHVATPDPAVPIMLGAFGGAALARVGRRADGWLPVVAVRARGAAADQADRLVRMRASIDDAARAAGRDPGAIATALRVNVAAGTSLDDVADAITTVVRRTGFTDVFVDPMYLADGADESLAVLRGLVDRLGLTR